MLCSYFQNNECKKISKFEGETRSNGIPLLQHGIFFFFHENFSTYIQKDSLQFFLMLCSYFQNNECKKISKFYRDDKSNGIPLLQHGFFFSFTRIFLHTFLNIPYNFFLCCVRISRIINAKTSRNSRGKSRAMESHLYSMEFVFSFTRIFLWTFTAIPSHFLLCCIRISWIMNAEKNLKLKRKHSSNGNPLLHNVFGRNFVSWIVSSLSHSCVVCHEKASVPRKERTT